MPATEPGRVESSIGKSTSLLQKHRKIVEKVIHFLSQLLTSGQNKTDYMKHLLMALLALAPCCMINAQTPTIINEKYYGGSGSDLGQFLTSTNDGNLILIGHVNSADGQVIGYHGGSDIWVSKISPSGSILWSSCLGGSNDDLASSFAYDNATGNIVILATSNSNNGTVGLNRGLTDIWICQLNSSGNINWQRSFGGSSFDRSLKIINTSDGNLLLSGFTQSTDGDFTGNHGQKDFYLAKLNTAGTLLWNRCYGGTNDDAPLDFGSTLLEPVSNSYLFSSNTASGNGDVSSYRGGISDAWIVRTDVSGNITWQRCLGGNGSDNIRTVKQAPNGQLIALVQTSSTDAPGFHTPPANSANHFDVLKVRMDLNGNTIREKCYGGLYNEWPYDLVIINDSTDIMAVRVENSGGDITGTHDLDNFSKDLWFCKTKFDTVIVWQRALGGTKDEQAAAWIGPGAAGVVTGSTMQLMPGNDLLFLAVSKSNDGDVKRILPYGSFSDNNLWMVVLDSSGRIKAQQNIGGTRDEWSGTSLVRSSRYGFHTIGGTESINNNQSSNADYADIWLIQFSGDNYVTGKVFIDFNSNNIQDAAEPVVNNAIVVFDKNGNKQFTLSQQGRYSQPLDSGRYQINAIAPSPYFTSVPAIVRDTFQYYFRTDTIDFALRPQPSKRDIAVVVVPLKELRPDSSITYRIHYFNQGTDTVSSGTVAFKKDPRFTFQSAVPPTSAITGDSLKWNYSNLKPLDTASIYVRLKVPASPAIQANDTVRQVAAILPITGDLKPIDNRDSIYQRVAALDTNYEKHENHGGYFQQQYIGQGGYLHYSIRYRNNTTTGITHLKIIDTLSVNIDSSSIQMIAASHPYTLQITDGKILTWTFNTINLPPYVNNNTNNICYVCFRAKPKSGSAIGTVIKNRARIEVDFNDPSDSNEVSTEIH